MYEVPINVAFKTIGCKVNQYETGSLRQAFLENGYIINNFNDKADIYIINTCAVTKEAVRKSKQMIRKAVRQNPSAIIIATGCVIEANLSELKDINISNYYLISNYYKDSIFSIFKDIKQKNSKKTIYYKPASQIAYYSNNDFFNFNEHVRGLIKIQDGCEQFCSYCIIPYLRGRARSRTIENIMAEAKNLISNGHSEIVLLGINLGSYGNDLKENKSSLQLLIQKMEKIEEINRIRLSSIEPPWVTDNLIDLFSKSSKICHHLHIPLQSGDDNTLFLMNRKYNTEQYERIVRKLKKKMPHIAITTDVIVGFPGEDNHSFEKTYEFIKKMGLARVHVFPFSERKSTLASLLPDKVKPDIIKERVKILNCLSKQLQRNFFIKNIGKKKNVLIEYLGKKNNKDNICGLTDNYIKVCACEDVDKIKIGEMVKIELKKVNESYVEGELIR